MYNRLEDVNYLLDYTFLYDIYDLSINMGGGVPDRGGYRISARGGRGF